MQTKSTLNALIFVVNPHKSFIAFEYGVEIEAIVKMCLRGVTFTFIIAANVLPCEKAPKSY